ncbi:MAG: adenylate/guanylate cyclase domain-containing protein [Alphaproteobacteria bacterium]
MERRLAAILATDVVGYSRLIRADEEGTLERLKALRAEIIEPNIAKHHGRIVKLMGDGMLAEFGSVVDAVRDAVEVQQAVTVHQADLPEGQRIQFRVGVNLGDVVIDGDDIHGDGVNVAARLEGLAEPGGICVSDIVYQSVKGKLEIGFDDLGEQQVKNISEPVRVYRIRVNAAAPAAATAFEGTAPDALKLPDKPSIAVLPFNNMSGDQDQEYLADGLAEDIITALSKISEMFVIARNSSFAYKGTSPDIRKVAKELGVRHVLEGSVRKAGNRVRITAQLIDAVTGSHLWAERYDRDLVDIFDLQDEITSDVVTALQVRLTEGEQARLRRRQTNNLAAWESYNHGQAHMRRFNRSDHQQALELLNRAVEQDPNFASAWCHLGWVHYNEARFGWCESPEKALEEAAELVERGLALDPDLPDGYSMLAIIRLLQHRYDEADVACTRALQVGQNSGDSCALVAMVLAYLGQPERSLDLVEKAMRLSPFYPDWYLGILGVSRRLVGQFDEAIAADLERLARNPENIFSDFRLAAVYEQMGQHDKATFHIKQSLKKNPEWSLSQIRISEAYRDQTEMVKFLELLQSAGMPE